MTLSLLVTQIFLTEYMIFYHAFILLTVFRVLTPVTSRKDELTVQCKLFNRYIKRYTDNIPTNYEKKNAFFINKSEDSVRRSNFLMIVFEGNRARGFPSAKFECVVRNC